MSFIIDSSYFRDCEAHHYKEDEIVKGHVYALDLNEYKVLYTINPMMIGDTVLYLNL